MKRTLGIVAHSEVKWHWNAVRLCTANYCKNNIYLSKCSNVSKATKQWVMRTSQEHALGGHAGSVDDQGSAHEGQEGAHGGHDLWAAREQGWQEYYYTRCMEQSIFESMTAQGCCK